MDEGGGDFGRNLGTSVLLLFRKRYEFFERQGGSIERIFFEFLRTRSYYESLNEVTIILKRERKIYFEIS